MLLPVNVSRRMKVIVALVLLFVFAPPIYLYIKFSRLVDEKLRNGAFANTSDIYAAPEVLSKGDRATPEEVMAYLQRAGYNTSPQNSLGYFSVAGGALDVHPGPASYFDQTPARLRFAGGQVVELSALGSRQPLETYSLEPQLITNLVDGEREKRRMVRFAEIPPVLVHALVSTEDKHFFQHFGFDPFRIAKAAYIDLRYGKKEQGASTLSMQLARGLWLDPEKNWKRKASELLITLILEQKLSKQEIFETYCNQVYLGRQDTFSIHGFGEGAQDFFNKDIKDLTLPEAALLAGLVQRPSYFNPYRYPDRAVARRNAVLSLMEQNGYITPDQYNSASLAPIHLARKVLEAGDAPYFTALMSDELQARLPDNPIEGMAHKVYTTLDVRLQNAAQDAVRIGMQEVDRQIRARRGKRSKDDTLPQVALIALDPRTGQVKAVVGGRDYARSQLNHALSKRQPGSVFKPFVYAAALNTAVEGSQHPFTPYSTIVDQPTTFHYENQTYQPSNFESRFYGRVTLQRALAKSMNLATVSLAEKVGYDKVVAVARRAGINDGVQPTPAVALGAYEATPLEISGAYTVFANHGFYVKPTFLAAVRSSSGQLVINGSSTGHAALDPRVAYLMVTMLQEVMRSGTAAGVRSRGFTAEAAGKTGTSRDGWFAGFTPDLLCVVWVGFDDNRELNLEGAHSALPIWTEFMKRAVEHREYAHPFGPPPPGIATVRIDPESGLLAGPDCPGGRPEYFIDGTQPKSTCPPFDENVFAGDSPTQASYGFTPRQLRP
jgi:penicillin-binding protein 1B